LIRSRRSRLLPSDRTRPRVRPGARRSNRWRKVRPRGDCRDARSLNRRGSR
jgi:hypothetical protein